MPVRAPGDLPDYLASLLPEGGLDPGHSPVGDALRHLGQEARQEALDAIPRLLGHLRSGKARKTGDVGALARLAILLRAVQGRLADVREVQGQVQALSELLGADTLEETVRGAAQDLASQAVRTGALSATSLAPVMTVMETARNASELIRQIQLLWNSNLDLPSLLTFGAVADEVVDQLEARLVALVTAAADEGEAKALAFVRQTLSPEDWIKAVK